MIRAAVMLTAAPLLAACATVSTGIVPAGTPDRYTVTERDSPLNGGARQAERDAMAEAAAFCRNRGESFVPAEGQQLGRPVQQQVVGPTGFMLAFRCRSATAPDAPDAASGLPP
jgi:hypothetical protein